MLMPNTRSTAMGIDTMNVVYVISSRRYDDAIYIIIQNGASKNVCLFSK